MMRIASRTREVIEESHAPRMVKPNSVQSLPGGGFDFALGSTQYV